MDVIPTTPEEVRAQDPWLLFRGSWGEAHPAFYNGPTGPAMKLQWARPITWSQTSWHPSAFAIPGGVSNLPDATTVFCGVIAKGSSVLTAAVQGGPVVFLAAAIAIVLLLLGLIRVDWRPSQPYALARRRTLGQHADQQPAVEHRHGEHRAEAIRRCHARVVAVAGKVGSHAHLAVYRQAARDALRRREYSGLDVLSKVAGETNAFLVTAAFGIWLLFSLMALTIVQAMVAHAMPRTGGDSPVTAREAYAAIRQFVRPLAAGLVIVTTTVLLLELTVIGLPVAIWLVVRWSLFAQCIVLENLSWRAALRRSAQLVHRRWLRVAWITLIVVGSAVLLGPAIGVGLILVSPIGLGTVNLISAFVSVLAVPYAAIATCYLYYDLRTREITERQPDELPAEAALT